MNRRTILVGVAAALASRGIAHHAMRSAAKVMAQRATSGNIDGLSRLYAHRAAVRHSEGRHRWAGHHQGRSQIERFYRNISEARLQLTFSDLWTEGPPWALRVVVLLDEFCPVPDNAAPYRNQVAIVLRTRWGRVVDQMELFFNTSRIDDLEDRLLAAAAAEEGRGIDPGLAVDRTSQLVRDL